MCLVTLVPVPFVEVENFSYIQPSLGIKYYNSTANKMRKWKVFFLFFFVNNHNKANYYLHQKLSYTS